MPNTDQDRAGPTPGTITLFHGTDLASAEGILEVGFRAVSVESILAALAVGFDIDTAAIRSHWAWGFAAMREDRKDTMVYFTGSQRAAARYARRGSEIRSMGLVAVWHLRHNPGDVRGVDRERRIEAEEWAKQMIATTLTPVVVRAGFPVDVLPPAKAEQYLHGEGIGDLYTAQEIAFLNFPFPADGIRREWISGYDQVDPCTCWRDGRPCSVCAL